MKTLDHVPPPSAPPAPSTDAGAVLPAAKPPPPRANGYELACWILLALGLVFTLHFHLLSALLAGLFVYALVHRITRRLVARKLVVGRAKVAALLIVSVLLIAVSAGIVLALIGLVRGRIGEVPEMMQRMTQVVEGFRDSIKTPSIKSMIPDAEGLHARVVAWFHEHTEELNQVGGTTGRIMLHALIGIVIGALLSFYAAKPEGPLSSAFFERMRRLLNAFEAVVFAQIKISAVNTALTSVYLLAVLPAFGVHMPFRGTLVVVTFVAGLVPVVGNLISNTVIVLISMGISSDVAVGSLVFLIVIHKLEYFLNAKIVGGHIHAAAWEILLAMLCFESAFGIAGVIVAPIAYAFIKRELMDRNLI